ncbi:glycosyltransferase [Falsiroseomonas sp. CW058]|uniref:glycosyltransferase n=1 Tax=Falsiroseomonas sp. CW058 TaxID=3388664 RepID=UPI003D31BFB0
MAGAPQGGAEAFFERLVLAQHRQGLDVLAVIRRDVGRAARLSAGGVAPVELPFGGPFDFLTGRRLRATLEAFRPQVVVAWMNRAARYCRAATPSSRPWTLVGRLGGQYDLGYYRGCDLLVANTRGLCDWIAAQGWPRQRLKHLPNFAADLAGAAPAALAGPRRILAMGRLHPNKDFPTLLRAMARLPGDAHLSLAGEGPERAALEALARELGLGGRVDFLGWRQDVGALLAGAEMLVVPSRIEPLGNVVLEGFSASRPVVATAADGPREVIEDGRTGLLVPIGDDAALAAAVAALLDDPARAQALAAAGRAEFEAHHAEAPVLAKWRLFLDAAARIDA